MLLPLSSITWVERLHGLQQDFHYIVEKLRVKLEATKQRELGIGANPSCKTGITTNSKLQTISIASGTAGSRIVTELL